MTLGQTTQLGWGETGVGNPFLLVSGALQSQVTAVCPWW